MLAAVANSLGQNVDDSAPSFSTLRRMREKNRLKSAEELKKSIKIQAPLTVHWDSKLMPSGSGRKLIDRLPVIVTNSDKVEQLLQAPAISSSSGKQMGIAVFESLKNWNLEKIICGMGFDTTISNTGNKNGACVLLQKIIMKDLLYFACRHHIFELVLEACFSMCMPSSSGPNIQLFQRFQKNWNMLKRSQPRDDYKELLDLVLTFIGHNKKPTFRAPGAFHRARWMAKAIYVLKIFMFQTQFALTRVEKKSLSRIASFIVSTYVFGWFEAPFPIRAPENDVRFLKRLLSYEKVDPEVAQAAIKKFSGHLWYLGEEMIFLSLFDNRVDEKTKKQMVEVFKTGNPCFVKENLTPIESRKIKAIVCKSDIENLRLEHFVSARSIRFFEILNIDSKWLLEIDPMKWEDDKSYQDAKHVVKSGQRCCRKGGFLGPKI
ncbi:unnamed protein product [Brassicogethes aeneus]|uniref:Uncharacterized protein n=1 Tax=Brassicogethes aeneus TaxID=1431903 RepID=A0A9P0ATH6_BRAAE|nr:unnamed protein product [Brassicogethes aeneus]